MDNTLWFYSSSSDSEENGNLNFIRKKIRNNSDPLKLPNNEFKKRFRLSKEAFIFVLELLEFEGHLCTSVQPKIQLAATLSLLGTGSFQHSVGNDFLIGISQSAICKISKRVVDEMERKLCVQFIQFNPKNSDDCKDYFMTKHKIPGVVGCVDGTHFGLQKPPNEHMFFNRKGFHSLNSMIICDHKHTILAINSKYGGAAHDSFVWRESEERYLLELEYNNSLRNFWLLGDSGYPCEPWLLTPYRSPSENSLESHFNDVHSKARCVVERTIGILKARWKILCHDKRSRYSAEKIAQFSNVCAALHNICINFRVPNYENVQQMPETYPALVIDDGSETNITKTETI